MSIWKKFSTPTKKKRWMNDSESAVCLLCESAWTVRLRRHHCRVCYRLVCSSCSDQFVELDADEVSHRVCDECFPELDIHLDLPCHTIDGTLSSSCAVTEHDALFKIVLHHVKGLFPPRSASSEASSLYFPPRDVYCTTSTSDTRVLKTTKLKSCDPLQDYKADLDEAMVMKADLSKVSESYLIFKIHDKGGSVVGTCRTSLGDVVDGVKISKVLLCKELLPLREAQRCLPVLVFSISRMTPLGVAPDLPMYLTQVPYAVDFSCLPPGVSKQRSLPLVHMFPPHSTLHLHLFMSLVPSASSYSGTSSSFELSTRVQPSPHLFIPANEILLEAIGNILHQSASGGIIVKGVLLCTTHRLVFIQYPLADADERMGTGTDVGVLQCFPLASIATLQVLRKYKGGSFIALQLSCKDSTGHIFICTNNCTNTQSIATPVPSAAPHRQVLLKPTRAIDAFQRVELEVSWRKLEDAFVPPSQSGHCNSLISFEKQFEGFSVKQKCIGQPFNILDEYARLGVFLPEELVGNKSPTHSLHSPPDGFIESNNTLSTSSSCSSHFQYPYIFQSKWRISVANTSYQACPTYPKYVIVPSAISDSHLALSSKQRSIDRIPVLTWIHPDNGASLCRSSQPLVGFVESACPEDETLLMSIRACTFFPSMINFCKPSRKSLSVNLKRRGYRVRRDQLSGTPVHRRCGRSGCHRHNESVAAPCGLKNSKVAVEVTSGALSCLFLSNSNESNHLNVDNKSKQQTLASGKKSTRTCCQLLQRSTQARPRKGALEKCEDGWYHPFSHDFGEDLPVSTSPCAESDLSKSGAPKDRTTSSERRRKPHQWRHKYHTLSSERLRQNCRLFSMKNDCSIPSLDTMISTRQVKLRIVDARPYINATGNALMGKGYEVVERLGGSRCTTLEFANIANIHVVKDSYQALRQACSISRAASSVYQTGDGYHRAFSATDITSVSHANVHVSNASQVSSTNQTTDTKCENFGVMVSETKWLQHLSSVLRGGLKCAEYLMQGDPVLVHCSDGWDRTSQVTGLAQLLVDPEYRTILGFKNLISKDFTAFGHKFRTRCGGVGVNADASQESPIFVQFLDAVWQVWRQMPWEFEFSQDLLQLLYYCYYSRFTSDFRFDTESEKFNSSMNEQQTSLTESDIDVTSIWTYISLHMTAFTNLLFKPSGNPSRCSRSSDTSESSGGAESCVASENVSVSSCMGCIVASKTKHRADRHSPEDVAANMISFFPPNSLQDDCQQPLGVSGHDNCLKCHERTCAGERESDLDDLNVALTHGDTTAEERSGKIRSGGGYDSSPTTPVVRQDHTIRTSGLARIIVSPSANDKDGSPCQMQHLNETKKNKPMLSATSKRWVHLLTPNCDVNDLLLWEAVYFSGLALPAGVKVKAHSAPANPSPSTSGIADPLNGGGGHVASPSFTFTSAASAAVAYERGLEALCREQQARLRAQEVELERLQKILTGKMTPLETLGRGNFYDGENERRSNQCVDYETPPQLTRKGRAARSRAHSDSSSLSASTSSGSYSFCSLNTNFSNMSSGSTASSVFQRHFRFNNPATLLFSPPLLAAPASTAVPVKDCARPPLSASDSHACALLSGGFSTPPPFSSKTPPKCGASTVLALCRHLHNNHVELKSGANRPVSPQVPALHTPSTEEAARCSPMPGSTCTSGSSVSSNHCAQISILATATILENHYS